jgi:hypothetical protein
MFLFDFTVARGCLPEMYYETYLLQAFIYGRTRVARLADLLIPIDN